MTITAKVFGLAQNALANKEIDWNSDVSIYCALTTSSYTPNQDTHDYWNDVTNEVANGNGYTTNGVALTTPTITYQSGSNRTELDADDASWTGSGAGFTFHYAVIYDRAPGSDATRPVISYVDFGADVTVNAGETKTIQWDSTGIVTLTAA